MRVVSTPHNFAATLLCQKQTINLLKPENDTVTLGRTYSSFTETTAKASAYASNATKYQNIVSRAAAQIDHLNESVTVINETLNSFSDKVLFNGASGYTLVAFNLEGLTFSSGAVSVDVNQYIPGGFNLVSCLAQLGDVDTAVINSVTISENTISIKCRTISGGSAYNGTASVIRCVGVCQKNGGGVEE